MRQATSAGKVALAVLSLVLAVFIWGKGLQESFSRPSVAPQLSMRQQEISLLAAPSVPNSFKPLLIGDISTEKLRQTLSGIPVERMNDRERLVYASLETNVRKRSLALEAPVKDMVLAPIQKALIALSDDSRDITSDLNVLITIKDDPLLYQVSCLAIGGSSDVCIDSMVSKSMALRLGFSQGLPAIAVLLGIAFLIRQIWLLLRKTGRPWPQLVAMPLSLLDMVLLVAGGFVVLGEVISPSLFAPFVEILTRDVGTPLKESLRVLIGYIIMTIPPLLILRQQLNGLKVFDSPDGGWFQWRFSPTGQAFIKAFVGWLMVLPLVLLISWLMNVLVGDQGGSNPLLELVLHSQEPFSLILLLITTVVLAPIFEELIFRGTLLPVLAQALGRGWGVLVSALIFALAHLSVGELPPLIVLGLGLAFLRLSSGRLFPCVLMHSLWNGITFASLLLLG